MDVLEEKETQDSRRDQTVTNPRVTLVEVAREWLGIRETSKNHFEGMQRLWAATSYPNGWENREPYCAAFACFVIAEAVKRNPLLSVPILPKSAAVKDWKTWARNPKSGVLVFKAGEMNPMPGDIVSLLPNLSHIAIVEKWNRNVYTIEGNTDDAGGREGNGFHQRQRAPSFCGEFYRIAAKATGGVR